MKKFLLSLATVLAGAFTMSAAPETPAEDNVVLDFSDEGWDWPTEYTKVEFSRTNGGYTVTAKGPDGAKKQGSALLVGKKDAYVVLPKMSYDVEKIEFAAVSGSSTKVTFNIFVDDEAVSTGATGTTTASTFNIAESAQAAGTQYVVKITNSNNAQFGKITFVKKATPDTPETPDTPDPVDPETPADIELGEGEALAWSVVYLSGSSDSNTSLSASTYAGFIESGAEYTTYSSSSNAYVYDGTGGIKFSSSSNNGTIVLNVAEDYQVNATKIILKASTAWASANPKLAVNGSAPKDVADYMTFELDGEVLETITIAATKRCYVKAIYVVVAAEDEPDPDPVDPDPTVYEAPEVMVATMEGYEAIEFTAEAVEFASLAAIYVFVPEGAEVYYTMDGSDPRTSDTAELFDEDLDEFITVYKSCTVKLVAKYDVEGEAKCSAVLSQEFVKAAYPQPTIKVVSDCGNPNFFVNSAIVTISAEGVAVVMYTLDGTTPSSMSTSTLTIYADEDGNVEEEITITEDAKIVAVSTDGMMTTSEAVTATITKWEKPNNHVEYRPVTSKSELTPGNAYIFVAHYVNAKNAIDTYYAMGTEVGGTNSNYLKAVEAEIHPDGSVYLEKVAGNNINEFYLEAAGDDTWRFFTYTNWTSGEENAKQYLQTKDHKNRYLITDVLPEETDLATVTIEYPEVSVEAEEATDAPAPTITYKAFGNDSKSRAMNQLCFNYNNGSPMFNVYGTQAINNSCFSPMLYTAGSSITTGVELVAPEANDAPAVYYNLQGVRVANPSNGIYVVVRGNKVSKEIVR